MTMPVAIVTRPEPQAARWVRALETLGIWAWALPLLQIGAVSPTPALEAAREQLGAYDAAMFVSAAAVAHFLGSKPGHASVNWSSIALKTRAWVTGPGTRRALLERGWPAERIDAPALQAGAFDSEALWQQVSPRVHPGLRVLIVRGGDAQGRPEGREWLADRLLAAGALVDGVVAYRRLPAELGLEEIALVQWAFDHRAVWVLSSTQALGVLRRRLPDAPWQRARALATHTRIAEAARALGFGSVALCPSDPAAVAASIKSLQ